MMEWIDTRPPNTIAIATFVVVTLFAWGLDTHGTFAGSGDEPHYAMIAHSLVFDGDLDLANDYADPENLVGAGRLEPEAHAIPGKDGRLRPVHDVGLPVLFAPYFAVAYRIGAASPRWIPAPIMARTRLNPPLVLRHLLSLAMIAIAGVMAIVLFHICRALSGTNASAVCWTLACVLSPPLLSHSFLFFAEIPSACIVTLFYAELARPLNRTLLRTSAIGAAVGFLLLLHVRNVGLVIGMIGVFVWTMRDERAGARQMAAFLVPVGVVVAIRTALNFHLWGSLITSPHASLASPGSVGAVADEITTRVLGLLFDQEHGLLAFAPIYLLVLPGALLLRKTDRRSFLRLSVLIGAYLVPVVLPFVNRHGWEGGWSPAGRFLVPIAPLLAVFGFGYILQRRALTVPATLLIGVQAAFDLLFWSRPKLMWNAETGVSAFGQYLGIARWLPSWQHTSTYSAVASVMLLAAWAAGSLAAVRAAREAQTVERASLL